MGRGYPPYGSGGYGQGAPFNKRKAARPGEHDDYARQTALQRELAFFDKVGRGWRGGA